MVAGPWPVYGTRVSQVMSGRYIAELSSMPSAGMYDEPVCA